MPILSVGEKTNIISCHSFLVIFNVMVTWHEFTTNVLQCYKQGSQQSFLKGSLPLLKKKLYLLEYFDQPFHIPLPAIKS
jgi:hypothetical protein